MVKKNFSGMRGPDLTCEPGGEKVAKAEEWDKRAVDL